MNSKHMGLLILSLSSCWFLICYHIETLCDIRMRWVMDKAGGRKRRIFFSALNFPYKHHNYLFYDIFLLNIVLYWSVWNGIAAFSFVSICGQSSVWIFFGVVRQQIEWYFVILTQSIELSYNLSYVYLELYSIYMMIFDYYLISLMQDLVLQIHGNGFKF